MSLEEELKRAAENLGLSSPQALLQETKRLNDNLERFGPDIRNLTETLQQFYFRLWGPFQ